MTTDKDRSPAVAPELRVHGVGGPQAVKMLGETDDSDVVTLPPIPVGGDHVMPWNTESRFARRLRGSDVEAYEWGGLTTGSSAKALWILYLPFTLLNAGGWAHAAAVAPSSPRIVRWHMRLTHAAAYLATLTYVAWIAYLTLELVARRWVDHVRTVDNPTGLTEDLILVWTPKLAPVVCLLLVAGLFLAPWSRGRFEEVHEADAGIDDDKPWVGVEPISHPQFFAHRGSHRRRLGSHNIFALVGVAAALLQYVLGWNRLGVVLLGLAGVQVIVLSVMVVVDWWARRSYRPSEVFADALITDPFLHNRAARIPAGAVFVVLGTALAHAAFSGLALTVSPLLARWPEDIRDDVLQLGPELSSADVLAWALVVFVLLAVFVLVRGRPPEADTPPVAGATEGGVAVRLARQTSRLAGAALIAFSLPLAVYLWLNGQSVLDQGSRPANQGRDCDGVQAVWCWYDTYEVDQDAVAKRLGSLVLLLLPGAVYGTLRRQHETGFGRVVGNVWDVLTFWPRRFHPHAAPCSAERAVPELRARIRHVMDELPPGDEHRMVVVGHSQGSVLAAAAIASLPPNAPVPSLLTYGSPLGTLYAPIWPAYVPPLVAEVRDRVRGEDRPAWVNFWRRTDPVGAQVPGAENKELADPQTPDVSDVEGIGHLRPLERPTRWGTVAGHGRYLAEPALQTEIRNRRPPRRRDG